MTFIRPRDLRRLQISATATEASLEEIGRDQILHQMAENAAQEGLHKILMDCIHPTGTYHGFSGQTLELDIFVLTPSELDRVIQQAMEAGRRETLTFSLSLHESDNERLL